MKPDYSKVVEALEHYAACSDGCTCGDGWGHDTAKVALPLAREMAEKLERYEETLKTIAALNKSSENSLAVITEMLENKALVQEQEVNDKNAQIACDTLAELSKDKERLTAELAACRQENNTLRGLLGNSSKDCPYCGLPAAEQAKCARGFPGCSRADDQQLSKHFADAYALEQAEAQLTELQECEQCGTKEPMDNIRFCPVCWNKLGKQLTELQVKYAGAVGLIKKYRELTKSASPKDWHDFYESTAEALASTPQSVTNLLAVLEAAETVAANDHPMEKTK